MSDNGETKGTLNVLVVNDNPAISTILEQVLDDDGHRPICAETLEEAEALVESSKLDVIILDEAVKGEDSMKLVDSIDKDSDIKVVVLTNGKKPLPKDKPMIVDVIRKPYKSTEITIALRKISGKGTPIPMMAPEMTASRKRIRFGAKPQAEPVAPKIEEGYIILFGKSYIVYEDLPKDVYLVTRQFIPQGGDIFVLSFGRSKMIQEQIGDERAKVMCVSAKPKFGSEDAGKLGTIMAEVMTFIDQSVRPVIVIDDLSRIIDINGINLSLMLVMQIFSGASKNFTMVLSVKEGLFTDKDKSLLSRYMEKYNFDLEEPPREQ